LEADLKKANLWGVNLLGANLRKANISYANLRFADLRYANLQGSDLSFANLRKANLSFADLSYANLQKADLQKANLREANLREADLREADLNWTIIAGTDLRGAKYDYKTLMLQVDWGELSDELTLELMRQDTQLIGEDLITAWANGGECPYEVLNRDRDYKFNVKKHLWKPGKPKYRKDQMWDLFEALCEEKGVVI